MSIEKVRSWLAQYGAADRILEFPVSSATVELAAQALNCEPCRIAKTLSFGVQDTPILIVAAGDARVDNAKFKAQFGVKAKMLSHEDAASRIGHAVGGVCPFAVNEGVEVYLDVSLKRFHTVFPAAGSSNSAIELTIPELEQFSRYRCWADVCKAWQDTP
ncbi:MAG: YbaK/EbsC family protein [Candidatus Faecousia sp.]|nr:YbaK/EbsC family protein [Candidatus Faecousia sp.]